MPLSYNNILSVAQHSQPLREQKNVKKIIRAQLESIISVYYRYLTIKLIYQSV